MVSPLPPECEQLLIVGYVLGNLSPAEAMLFEELLTDNPELKEQVKEFQQTLEFTYNSLEVAPSPELKDKVLAACIAKNARQLEQTSVTVKPPVTNTIGTKSFRSKIIGAIAVVLVVALGYSNYRFWQALQTAKSTIPEAPLRTYRLKSEDLAPEVTTELIVNPALLRATLTTNNLPPLASDRVYALWTVVNRDAPYTTDEKSAILTAVFEVGESGDLVKEIILPQPHLTSEEIAKIAITVEDKSAPQAHQGSIFIATENLN